MQYRNIKPLFILFLLTITPFVWAKATNDHLNEVLESLVTQEQAESDLVALGAILSRNNQTLAIAVSGERQIDSGIAVTRDDKWHLGSITKSVTATMIARLVERDILQWSTTVGEIFKSDDIHASWQDVTLHMLLTHTSGAEANFPWRIQSLRPAEGAERQSLRKNEVLKILREKPDSKPGSKFEYSNVGYTIAGVMAAVKTGKSWENLIREEVFKPLALKSAGFGPPVDPGNPQRQPLGHSSSWFSGKEAVTEDADNSPIMGPAGTIHMSLADLSAYGNAHLAGRKGQQSFLKQSTFETLHKMGPDDYAYGWIAARKTAWIDNREVLYHNGSNTLWYALIVMIPELQLSIAVTSNDGDISAAGDSAWKVVRQITKHLLEKESQ